MPGGSYDGAIQAALTAAAAPAAAVEWEPKPAFSVDHASATDSHAADRGLTIRR